MRADEAEIRLTLARAPLATQLDIIKFVCKDLFLFVYAKQIDNLRTNHRVRLRLDHPQHARQGEVDAQGTFVLQSHAFPPLVPLSSYKGQAADQETAKLVSLLVYGYAALQQHD